MVDTAQDQTYVNVDVASREKIAKQLHVAHLVGMEVDASGKTGVLAPQGTKEKLVKNLSVFQDAGTVVLVWNQIFAYAGLVTKEEAVTSGVRVDVQDEGTEPIDGVFRWQPPSRTSIIVYTKCQLSVTKHTREHLNLIFSSIFKLCIPS